MAKKNRADRAFCKPKARQSAAGALRRMQIYISEKDSIIVGSMA